MNRKSKILILLEQSSDYKLLSALLEKNYEIIQPEKFPDVTLNYDLIILDGITHNRYKDILAEEKARANPLFLPVLILTGKKDVDIAASFLWKTVDEMIVLPVNKTELHARVEMLLRTRKQSIEIDYSHNRIIKQNREQLNLAVKAANVGLWDWDLETNKVYYSSEWKKQIGYEDNEISNEHTEWSSRVHPDDIEHCRTIINNYLKNPWPDYKLEFRFRHKNGTYLWIYTQASLIFNDEGKPVRMLGSHVDISEQKKSEEILNESEKKYRILFDSNPHPMWVYDIETLKFIEVNHAAILKYGYSHDEFLTLNLTDIRPEEDVEKLYENVKKGTDAYTFSGEWRHKNKSGDIFVVEIISHSINFEDKKARLVLANDITERKKTEDKLKLYIRAIEQSPVSLNITDSKGRIIYVNSGFTALSGYTSEEVVGRNPRFLKSGVHSQEKYKELWETITSGKNWSGELCNKNKNGNLYWVQASISPVVDSKGSINHYVAVKEDITERKKMIDELIKEKEKAEESDRLKSAFLANMSHEIRTPMNGILGFTSLLLEPDLSSDEKSSFIDTIHKSGQRMLNTVNDIIEVSKIEAGLISMHITPVSVDECLNEIIAFFTPEAEKKGLQLTLSNSLNDHPDIRADKNKLDSILTNLVKNAIKYTDSGMIDLACTQHDENIEFYVKDTGIGIPANRLDAVFNRFEQADIADTRAFQGSGLGLAIAKSYIEMLGGKIWVESELGIGSTFFFTIPNKVVNNEMKVNEDKTTYPIFKAEQTLKVLIAEDDEASFIFLKTILSKNKIKSIHAVNGLEAVNAVKENPDISIILMDIKMPVMSGIEATLKIRQFNQTIPIIAQTAYAFLSEKDTIMNAGCNDLISKPIRQDELINMIFRYTSHK